jgi:hypothetical protein
MTADTITSVAPTGTTLAPGAATTISWTNNGGFSRNVTIELSTDGGATFPTVIASNVANSGSRAWTVPNTPTTQARVRVREHDFVAPAGVSAANFAIAVNTAPTFTPAAAITRQQGSAGGAAVTVGTVADAQTAASVAASCTATAGTLRFQVSDGSLTGTGNLQVNVTANTAPALTYAAQSGAAGASLTVNPATGPSDNGSVASVALFSQGTYTGGISVNASSGAVSLTNLAPEGTHTITLRATDNCGATIDAAFNMQVSGELLFVDGFEPPVVRRP